MDTEEVRQALRKKFKSPEWITMEEVGNGTGANCKRHADMILFNMYPSRGLALVGIEIKISRSDLKHELDTPQKAEEIAQYCNEWYLATPKGLIHDDDIIPVNWGILEIDNKGTVKKRKAAKWFDDKPIPKSFWAALMRKATDKINNERNSIWDDGYAQSEKRYKEEIKEARALILANTIRKQNANVINALDKIFGYRIWCMKEPEMQKMAAIYNDMNLYDDLKNVINRFAYDIKNYDAESKRIDDVLKQSDNS